jgi:hypothetical protein
MILLVSNLYIENFKRTFYLTSINNISEDGDSESDDLGYTYQEPSRSTSMDVPEDENNKSDYNKPRSKCSAYEFLMHGSTYVNVEVTPEKCFKNFNQKDYWLNGFEVAVVNNDLETVKKILDWAEKHQCVVEGKIFF